jgi:hypothetical protein
MQTNFDNVALSPDRKTITASGGIVWEPGDHHCKITASLSQNDDAIWGSNTTQNYNVADRIWHVTVSVSYPHGGKWDPDVDVHCVGIAVPPTSVPWPPQDLQFEQGAVALTP